MILLMSQIYYFSILFADDTNVFISSEYLIKMTDKINTCGLVKSLNIDKTHYMIFRTSNKKYIKPSKLEFNDNDTIKQVLFSIYYTYIL